MRDMGQIQAHQNYVISSTKFKPDKKAKANSKQSSGNNSRNESKTNGNPGRLTLIQRQDLIAK